MAYVKNAKGRVVSVPDERAEYLLDPAPTYTDDKGKKIAIKKSKDEEGFTKPTAAEIAEYRKTHAPKDEDEGEDGGKKKPGRPKKDDGKGDEGKDDEGK